MRLVDLEPAVAALATGLAADGSSLEWADRSLLRGAAPSKAWALTEFATIVCNVATTSPMITGRIIRDMSPTSLPHRCGSLADRRDIRAESARFVPRRASAAEIHRN